MYNESLALGLTLCLLTTGCLQSLNPTPPEAATPNPSSGETNTSASPTPSPPNATNTTNTTPTTPPPLNLTIQPHASYATLHAHPNHTLTNLTLTNPQHQTQTLPPNQPTPITLGHLTPNTTYTLTLNATNPPDTTQTQTLTFTTQPPKRTYPNPENETTIQPGDYAIFQRDGSDSGCTLNVVLRNPTNTTLYMLTARHCATKGDTVYQDNDDNDMVSSSDILLGTVAQTNTAEDGDWALIEINPGTRDTINPTVRHWTGPTAVTSKPDVDYGDTVCWYGHGSVLEEISRHRCGNLTGFQNPNSTTQQTAFGYRGLATPGDSGAPVIHYATGTILGIHSSSIPPIAAGTSLCSALGQMSDQGYNLSLLTQPYVPPEKDMFLPFTTPPDTTLEPGGPCPSTVWTP